MKPAAAAAWAAGRPNPSPVGGVACQAPWVSLEFDPAGWVYACCANQHHPLGRIGDERLADVWNGQRAQVLRDAVRRWDFSVGCFSCRWHLEHGRLDTDTAVYDRYPLDDLDPARPRAMTFALSNRCNLGCTMCNGELSSTIRHREGRPPLQPRYDDRFFDDLGELLGDLVYAKFLGGEPLLVPEHERVWQMMDELGAPTRLQITTNGTVWNDRVEWLLDRFDLDVTVSIDAATAATYESIRVGASHEKVMDHVARFDAARRRRGTELRFCFCLMTVNWHELADFLGWADDLDVPVSVNVVSDPGLALHELPTSQLEAVATRWRSGPQPAGRNHDVWLTQVRQLDAVLAERDGRDVAPRRARRPSATLTVRARDETPAPATPFDVDVEIELLAAWASGGDVAHLHVDDDDIVLRVVTPHGRLGIDATLAGRPLGDVLTRIGEADGRSIWEQDFESTGGANMLTYVLNDVAPARGRPATVLRVVCGRPAAGAAPLVVLVAEDRIHERHDPGPPPASPVRLSRRWTGQRSEATS